ncbi:hypothetical protein J132_06934 [Termitomyces sp. J132]|nr:hypothetical protein J132_06934 [Termitomyces sp. J132]
MFIIDDFSFTDADGFPTVLIYILQIGGGGTYAAIGARIWLSAEEIGMIIDKGYDFPTSIETKLSIYGPDMWIFRDQPNRLTTHALNSYRGEHRNFEYTTPGIRITPKDLVGTRIPKPRILHFICSPKRASDIISEVHATGGWCPIIIYEPIPDKCVPEELPALIKVLPGIAILSPNAEEALSLLSIPLPPTPSSIEQAADRLLSYGIGDSRKGWVIIRSGGLGAYVKTLDSRGQWIDAYWSINDSKRIVDVTGFCRTIADVLPGAGNSFLGGLAAGLMLTGDVVKATFHASVSASFIIEQEGLPILSQDKVGNFVWNGDVPHRRLNILLARHKRK